MIKKLMLFSGLLISSTFASAQCSGCTVTISGVEVLPQIVAPGTTLCITSSGDLQGELTIVGGTVCNDGLISSDAIAHTSGDLINNGEIDATDYAGTEGTFTNEGDVTLESFGVLASDYTMVNNGDFYAESTAMADNGLGADPTITNNGDWETDDMGSTNGGTFTNNGDLLVDLDFGSQIGATLLNYGYMDIGGDFGNLGNFHTECMINVGGSWANSGTITGPAAPTSCGGFTVDGTGGSANDGDYGADDSYLDFCSAGTASFDLNTGTIGTNVTTCSCSETCELTTSITETVSIEATLYPNPMELYTNLLVSNSDELKEVHLLDLQGKVHRSYNSFNSNQIQINRADLESGIYLLYIQPKSGSAQSIKLVVR